MNENVKKFFELYERDEGLRARIAEAEAAYPGSLEIRDAVVSDIILPIAEELGLPFTLMELRVYETRTKVARHPDVELTEEDLRRPDDSGVFFLIDKGWSYDKDLFKEKDDAE